jgi:hypothetical protein
MRHTKWIVMGAALALVAATSAGGATSRDEYRAVLKRIAADHREARALCRKLSGQARRECFAEAEADMKKATAAADADHRDSPLARKDAKIAAANADYALARVKCGAKSDEERRECIKSAKAIQADAVADAVKH